MAEQTLKALVTQVLDNMEARSSVLMPKGIGPKLVNEAHGDILALTEVIEVLEKRYEKMRDELAREDFDDIQSAEVIGWIDALFTPVSEEELER